MLGTGPLAPHPATEWADDTPDYEVLALADAVAGAQSAGSHWNSRGRGRGFGRGGWRGGNSGGSRGRFRQEERYKSNWKGGFTTKHFTAPADPLNRVNYDRFFVVSALKTNLYSVLGTLNIFCIRDFRHILSFFLLFLEQHGEVVPHGEDCARGVPLSKA